jgi:hypothetical protein
MLLMRQLLLKNQHCNDHLPDRCSDHSGVNDTKGTLCMPDLRNMQPSRRLLLRHRQHQSSRHSGSIVPTM